MKYWKWTDVDPPDRVLLRTEETDVRNACREGNYIIDFCGTNIYLDRTLEVSSRIILRNGSVAFSCLPACTYEWAFIIEGMNWQPAHDFAMPDDSVGISPLDYHPHAIICPARRAVGWYWVEHANALIMHGESSFIARWDGNVWRTSDGQSWEDGQLWQESKRLVNPSRAEYQAGGIAARIVGEMKSTDGE